MVEFFVLSSYCVENECFACMSGGPPRCLPFPFPRQGCLPGLCSKPFADACPPAGLLRPPPGTPPVPLVLRRRNPESPSADTATHVLTTVKSHLFPSCLTLTFSSAEKEGG